MRFLIATSFILIFCCGLCRPGKMPTKGPRAKTPLGVMEGTWKISSKGRLIKSFLGIPYAVSPVAERRFQIPEPIPAWKGVLNAKHYGSRCIQIDETFIYGNQPIVSGSEDCLNLNVYIPERKSKKKSGKSELLPVIFFIPGGGFQFGNAARYGPEYLLDRDVILVTFNHRIGILGFMSTEDDTVSGNMGLKDQVLALRWVSENICYFGGDPKRVTLVGQGSGAVSVHYHYLTNSTKGLFQGGISIGGSALTAWAQTENSLGKAKRLASILNCPTNNVPSMVSCLKVIPAANITIASLQFRSWLMNPVTPFGPVVEKGNSKFKFIDRSPIELIMTKKVQDRSWITSAASQGGLVLALQFMTSEKLLKELNDRWVHIAPDLLEFNHTIPDSQKKSVALKISEHYLGQKSIDKSTIKQMIAMITDRLLGYDLEKAAVLQAQANKSPVRFYLFSYRGKHAGSELYTGNNINYGVNHADDLSYILNTAFDTSTTKQDRKMQKLMINLWVSYATTGTPKVPVKWPQVRPHQKTFNYLHIAKPDNVFMDGSDNYGEKKFWQTIPFAENVVPL